MSVCAALLEKVKICIHHARLPYQLRYIVMEITYSDDSWNALRDKSIRSYVVSLQQLSHIWRVRSFQSVSSSYTYRNESR